MKLPTICLLGCILNMDYQEMQTLPQVIRDFLFYIEGIKGKSKLTVQEYYLDLRTFFRFLKQIRGLVSKETNFDEIPIDDVDVDLVRTVTLSDIHSFLVYCKNDRENNASTRARKTCTMRVYFKYLTTRANLLTVNPAEQLDSPKLKSSLPKHLSLEESLTLLQAVDGEHCSRDYAILTLFLNCGLRLSELCGLNMSDIHSDNSMRVTGKGNKERTVYLNDACLAALSEYLKERPVDGVPADHKSALFLSRLKRRISNKTVQHIVYTCLDRAGLSGEGYSVHKLRHTAATLMYQHGQVDIRVLKDILGHVNLSTTQIYTHLSNKQIEDAVRANPLANVGAKRKKADDESD